MSLLEGHGDVTMDRAGAAAIPSAARFSEVLRQRRNQARGPARLLQQLIGIEAKMRQYEEGERFIAAVEESGGPALLDNAWRGPEWLPSLEEIRDPAAWIARVGAAPALVAADPLIDAPRDRRPAVIDALLARCTLPAGRHTAGLRRLRRCRLPGPAGPGGGGRLPGDRRPRRPRPAPGSAAEAGVVAAAAARFGAGVPRPSGWRCADGPNLEARAREARWQVLGPGGGHRAHRRRPGRDGAGQPAAGGRRRRAGRHAAGAAHPLLGLRRAETGGALRPRRARPGDATRPTTTPGSCATGCAPSCCRCARELAGRDVVPVLARQAAAAGRRRRPARRAWPRLVDPTDARALAAAPDPWPGGPSGGG